MKIRQVGAEFFYADGRTDRHDENNSRFSQFWDNDQKYIKIQFKPQAKVSPFLAHF
jgi:hypothetical protein